MIDAIGMSVWLLGNSPIGSEVEEIAHPPFQEIPIVLSLKNVPGRFIGLVSAEIRHKQMKFVSFHCLHIDSNVLLL